MITSAEFKATFPEFQTAPDALVTQEISIAARRCDPSVFDDLTDFAVGLLTADQLATGSFGMQARMTPGVEGEETPYMVRWRQLARTLAAGPYVIGTVPSLPPMQ